MRFRSIVLPTAVALAAVVAVPSSANAAVQCGLLTPTKVVVDTADEARPVYVTTGCRSNAADHAHWDYVHRTGEVAVNFTAAQIDGLGLPQPMVTYGDQHIGRWVLTPRGAEQADGTPLTQNSAVTYVKYASRFDTRVARTSTRLIMNATALQYSARDGGGFVVRPDKTVGLFHRASPGAAWKYVTAATTSSSGEVTFRVASPKSGDYRLVVAETATVWASYSYTVPGRV